MSDVRVAVLRAAQGRAAMLSVSEAARLLGFSEAREWIETHVRVRYMRGHRRVLWGDVIAASEADQEPADEGRATRGTLRRRRRV